MKRNIVTKVLAFLNLTNEGRIANFYDKVESVLKKEIKTLRKNIEVYKDQLSDSLEELNEKIEDAQVRVAEAYQNVKPEDVQTNEAQNNYIDTFWYNIERAEEELADLNSRKEKLEKNTQEMIETAEKQIAERERRLEMIQ